jgi:hypothetical protein
MALYLRFEKGVLAGLVVGLLAVAVLVTSGSHEVATEALGETLTLLVHVAFVLVSVLAGGVFGILVGRWSTNPWRGVLFGLLLGGIAYLLRGSIADLVALLIREPLPLDLTDFVMEIPRLGARLDAEVLATDRAEQVARGAAAGLYGVLWGLLFGVQWSWSGRHHRAEQSPSVAEPTAN